MVTIMASRAGRINWICTWNAAAWTPSASNLAGPFQTIAYGFFEHGLVSGPPLGCNVLRTLDIGDAQANRHWAGGLCFSLFQQRIENVGVRPLYA